MTSERRPRGRLRENILDAADQLLFSTGDASQVSIDAVVSAVGCTPPSLYYYFPSKDALLLEVCGRQYRRFAEELEGSMVPAGDPVEELVARGHAYLEWAAHHREHYRVLFMTAIGSPPKAAEHDARHAAGLSDLIDNIDRAIAAGRLAPGDSLRLALILWSTVHGMASLVVANPTIPLEYAHAVVETTSRAVLGALAPPSM